MEDSVKVLPSGDGNVISVSGNNPSYGYIRIGQRKIVADDNGWIKEVNNYALVHGKISLLESLNWKIGMEVPGKIVIKESLTPFNTKDPEIDIKIAGNTGVICKVENNPIYRKSVYTTDLSKQDELISHTNGDEIRLANNNLNLNEVAEENEDFDSSIDKV